MKQFIWLRAHQCHQMAKFKKIRTSRRSVSKSKGNPTQCRSKTKQSKTSWSSYVTKDTFSNSTIKERICKIITHCSMEANKRKAESGLPARMNNCSAVITLELFKLNNQEQSFSRGLSEWPIHINHRNTKQQRRQQWRTATKWIMWEWVTQQKFRIIWCWSRAITSSAMA